jgi:hypothetical protein
MAEPCFAWTVRVPPPIRYAVHKLLVAQERKPSSPKRAKDLKQAQDLIDVLLETDAAAFEDALQDARTRGPKWRKNIDASLRKVHLQIRQGSLFQIAHPRSEIAKRGQR